MTLFVSATSAAKLIEPDSLELVMVCGWNGTISEQGYRNYFSVVYGSILPANGLINGNTTSYIVNDGPLNNLFVYLTYSVAGQPLLVTHFDSVTITGTFVQGAGSYTLLTSGVTAFSSNEAQGSFVSQWSWLGVPEVVANTFIVGNSYDVVFNWTNT